MNSKRKILIIKTGASETFVLNEIIDNTFSIGDVVRTSVLLDLFEKDDVTLVTNEKCHILFYKLSHNVRCITPQELNPKDLSGYDICLNLERNFGPLMKNQKNIIGFIENQQIILWDGRKMLLNQLMHEFEREGLKTWSDWLFYLLGKRLGGQGYNIYRPDGGDEGQFDVALNWRVGKKWPTKQVPFNIWKKIEDKCLAVGFDTQMQPRPTDLLSYMRWIAKARVVVTNDSLGLHLGLAYNKKVICFFGATSAEQVKLNQNSIRLSFDVPAGYNCLPCYSAVCYKKSICTEFLDPEKVFEAVKKMI